MIFVNIQIGSKVEPY